MLNDRQQNYLTVQLNQAAIACDTEHRLRVAAEQRALEARTLLLEMAQRLLPVELDDLRQSQTVDTLPNIQLAHWLTDQLSASLFNLQSLTGRMGQQRLAHCQLANQKLTADLAARDQTISTLQAEVKQLASSPDAVAQLEARLAACQAALAQQSQSDLNQLKRWPSTAAESSSPASIATPASGTASKPSAITQVIEPAALDWYETWLADTSAELLERQQHVIHFVAAGDAFFRSEIVETLNRVGILRDDPDTPSGLVARLFSSLGDLGIIEELDSGYGASVPRAILLTEKGRAAFERLTGQLQPQTLLSRLLDRHKTPEHTVLNLMARNVLRRFGFGRIDLFPEPWRTSGGALVSPDIVATSPEGELLIIECERMRKFRTPDERANKWGDLAAITNGQLYVVVPGQAQQRDLISEVSQWAIETRAHSAKLFVCQFQKAIRPEATSPWTYTTSWSIP